MKNSIRFSISVLTLALSVAVLPLVAHDGEPLAPHDAWTAWSWDPWIVVGLLLSAVLYRRGAGALLNVPVLNHGVRRWEAICFWLGWWSLAAALVSPIHPIGEVLFSAHMLQHEILMLASAPLLVLGRPMIPFLWGLPKSWRRPLGSLGKSKAVRSSWDRLTTPFTAWWIHAVALWAWHAPALFEATLESDFVHSLQHVSFLASAILFWWAVLQRKQARMGYGAACIYVFTTAVHSSVLGALLTFSPVVWYPAYGTTTSAWGLTALEDQQLGGLIMWVPAGVVFVLVGLALAWAWMQESERLVERRTPGRTSIVASSKGGA